MKIKRPDDSEFDTTHEDWHVAGHAKNARDMDEAVHYVASYRDEIEREHREVCICAAIRLPDGRVFRGHRHHDCIRIASAVIDYRHSVGLEPTDYDGLRADMSGDSQGFVTSRNRYVTRAEGMQLQLAAGIESAAKGGYRGTLFSEDLY